MLGDDITLFVFKSLFTMPSNVLPLHHKQTLLPIIWIFNEGQGDEIKYRLPFKIFSTLTCSISLRWIKPYPLRPLIWYRVSNREIKFWRFSTVKVKPPYFRFMESPLWSPAIFKKFQFLGPFSWQLRKLKKSCFDFKLKKVCLQQPAMLCLSN